MTTRGTFPGIRPAILSASAAKPRRGECFFTVDVEDWFHIPVSPELGIGEWAALPSRVSDNFRTLLEILSEKRVRATCFFLGWIAERFPELVREAAARGHEIACHSYAHRLVYQMTPDEFLDDLRRGKGIIEDIAGVSVQGYRAPCFSVTEQTPWFFDKLVEAGYRFDSSIFPSSHRFGGMRTARWDRHEVKTAGGSISEFPIPVVRVLARPICFFGGGHLRFFPYPLIRRMGMRVLREGRPLIFYVHPREIDPTHPRLDMGPLHRFKSYVNVHTTRAKIERLLGDFSFTTFHESLANS